MQDNSSDIEFQRWISQFKCKARRNAISACTLDHAFAGVVLNKGVLEKDSNQSEFVLPIWTYLERAVSEARVINGKVALQHYAAIFSALEQRYGVEKEVIAAVWGLESAYGAMRGDIPVIAALATLAFAGRRAGLFETQLLAALQILQSGDVDASEMIGSWAGAMGHTQFMPTSFLLFAVDADQDGRRDIWSDDPSDALGSTAAYLSGFGWQRDQPWGAEVALPSGFDFELAGMHIARPVAEWLALGVRPTDSDRRIEHAGNASILLPAGSRGPAFLVFANFGTILCYNNAHAYAIAVGHLADRLAGCKPIQGNWPTDDEPLNRAQMQELQQRLTANGHDTFGADGIAGPNTFAALRAFQKDVGDVPDGFPSMLVLQTLRDRG